MSDSDQDEAPKLDFGLPLGAAQGVVFYSNLDDYFFSGTKNYFKGLYLGYQFQCVEGARRHMLITQGCIFGQCGPAHEIFDMTEVDNVVTGEKHRFVACPNGATERKPQPGDTLVYAMSKKMPVGHVAVISEVGDDWAGIAEENQESFHWDGKAYGRKVPLKKTESGHWLLEETDPALENARGWLYVDGVEKRKPLPHVTDEDLRTPSEAAQRGDLYPPLEVKPEFIAQIKGTPKQLARFATPAVNPAQLHDHTKWDDERDQQATSEEFAKIASDLKQWMADRRARKANRQKMAAEYETHLKRHFDNERAATKPAASFENDPDIEQHPHHISHNPTAPTSPFFISSSRQSADGNNANNSIRPAIKHPERGEIRVPFARAGVPRDPAWHSAYAPNEELGVSSIGVTMRAFKLVEQAVVMFADAALSGSADQQVNTAKLFDMPPDLFAATARMVKAQAATPGASSALSRLDFGLGTLGLVFDYDTDHYKILHTEFDSLAYLIEIHQMQEYYTKQISDIKEGWLITTFGNDFHRAVRNFFTMRRHVKKANKQIIFVDFGPADELNARLVASSGGDRQHQQPLSRDVLYHYATERHHALFLIECLAEFLIQKMHDVAVGDIQAEDMPQWTVHRVDFWNDDEVKIQNNALYYLNKKSNGGSEQQQMEEAFCVWKMCPWSHLFAMWYGSHSNPAAHNKLGAFIGGVGANVERPSVFQPLWTHLVNHPQFLPYLAEAATAIDATAPGESEEVDAVVKALDGDKACDFVIPVTAFEVSEELKKKSTIEQLPPIKFGVRAFEGMIDPHPVQGYSSETQRYKIPERIIKEHGDSVVVPPAGRTYHPAMHSLIIGGKRSAALMLEGRRMSSSSSSPAAASVYDLVHPAAMVYNPYLFNDRSFGKPKQIDEEKKDDDE